jgi:hypothetical protein
MDDKINNILYKYLKDEWYKNNLPKYHKYFDVWVNCLTENQIYG